MYLTKNSRKTIDIALVILLIVIIAILGVLMYQRNEFQQPHAITMAERLAGQFLLDIEHNGVAWYVHPETFERYTVGVPDNFNNFIFNAGNKVSQEVFDIVLTSTSTQESLEGFILINPSKTPLALYFHPGSNVPIIIEKPGSLLHIIREVGKGISNSDLERIPKATSNP